jgi:hypothetical protein
LQVPFSGGSWLSGFAPNLGTFPNYNMTGLPGAGEAPEAVLEYCLAANSSDLDVVAEAVATGLGIYKLDNPLLPDVNGDGDNTVQGRCEDMAALAAAAIMVFVDHHGEPSTPGRFPRYIPHQRQGWPNTVVTSYTASSQNQGHGISQLFETSAKFLDGADSTDAVTWFSMSDESAGGCSGDWCEWLYDPVTPSHRAIGEQRAGHCRPRQHQRRSPVL